MEQLMKMILLLSLLTTLLIAKNPYAYSVIGDGIYNNADKILKLRKIVHYKSDKAKINSYFFDVKVTKEIGFKLDSNDKSIDKKKYLSQLRTLLLINNYFLRTAYDNFEISMKNEDSYLFSKIINTGIIDTKKYKKEILQYYDTHKNSINPRGIIQKFIDEEKRLKVKKSFKKHIVKNLKQLQMQKMKRIIAKDKADQILMEKSLEDELIKKKLLIQKEFNKSI